MSALIAKFENLTLDTDDDVKNALYGYIWKVKSSKIYFECKNDHYVIPDQSGSKFILCKRKYLLANFGLPLTLPPSPTPNLLALVSFFRFGVGNSWFGTCLAFWLPLHFFYLGVVNNSCPLVLPMLSFVMVWASFYFIITILLSL